MCFYFSKAKAFAWENVIIIIYVKCDIHFILKFVSHFVDLVAVMCLVVVVLHKLILREYLGWSETGGLKRNVSNGSWIKRNRNHCWRCALGDGPDAGTDQHHLCVMTHRFVTTKIIWKSHRKTSSPPPPTPTPEWMMPTSSLAWITFGVLSSAITHRQCTSVDHSFTWKCHEFRIDINVFISTRFPFHSSPDQRTAENFPKVAPNKLYQFQ